MGDVARYFDAREFACPCCGQNDMDPILLLAMDWIRHLMGCPVIVTSGYRCKQHNSEVGGHPMSYHTSGRACDFKVPGLTPEEVFQKIKVIYPIMTGFGIYSTWVHVDTGPSNRKAMTVWRKHD